VVIADLRRGLVDGRLPLLEHRDAGHRDRAPHVVVMDAVEVRAGARLALAHQQVRHDQVAHRPRDGRRADLEPLGEVGGGVAL